MIEAKIIIKMDSKNQAEIVSLSISSYPTPQGGYTSDCIRILVLVKGDRQSGFNNLDKTEHMY